MSDTFTSQRGTFSAINDTYQLFIRNARWKARTPPAFCAEFNTTYYDPDFV